MPEPTCSTGLELDEDRGVCLCPNGGEYRDGLCYLDGSVSSLDGMVAGDAGVPEDDAGESDAGEPDACAPRAFYRDADGDGFGDRTVTMSACEPPEGYVEDDTDCDDACEDCNPDGDEVCDAEARDEDCDGTPNLGCECTAGSAPIACGTTDVGECSRGAQHCVDGEYGACEGAIEPADETCNGLDDDCDGSTDEGLLTTFYRDCDGDGYAGSSAGAVVDCAAPALPPSSCGLGGEWTTREPTSGQTDCRDTNDLVFPGQSAFFPDPIAGTSSYDYDCDGNRTLEITGVGSCQNLTGTCAPRSYWRRTISAPDPDCGVEGELVVSCNASCGVITAPRRQGCR